MLEIFKSYLSEKLARKHCIMTGRGASAIYISLKALKSNGTKVVLPAISCPSPANASIYAGFTPIFCDVSLSTFGMCPESLSKIIDEHNDIAAVMPVHLYGLPAQIEKISAICKLHQIPLIEDAAQSLGGYYLEKPLGSWGDVSIVSFGHTKQIEVGWGGAVLTDDTDLAIRLEQECSHLPDVPENIDTLFAEWRMCYYKLQELRKMGNKFNKLFLPLPSLFQDMYLFKLSHHFNAENALTKLKDLERNQKCRLKNAHMYANNLDKKNIVHPILNDKSAPWRYSFLVPSNIRDYITSELRSGNIHASNWYPSLHKWYAATEHQGENQLLNAHRVDTEILNLWVTSDTTEDQILNACTTINNIIHQNSSN